MKRNRATAERDRNRPYRPALAAAVLGLATIAGEGAPATERGPAATTGTAAAEAIGAWIVSSDKDPATGAERHVAMTTSSQGTAVIGLRCLAGKPSALIGLNKGSMSFTPGDRIAVTIRTAGEPHGATMVATSSELAEFDVEVSRGLIRDAAAVPSFALHLATQSEPDTPLVFRPALTRRALTKLAAACGIDLGTP
jgi:hypothetical protein